MLVSCIIVIECVTLTHVRYATVKYVTLTYVRYALSNM
jgi:hypothetical protein